MPWFYQYLIAPSFTDLKYGCSLAKLQYFDFQVSDGGHDFEDWKTIAYLSYEERDF